jgi:16S rRNA (cytosine967-C5)-methyltransferase
MTTANPRRVALRVMLQVLQKGRSLDDIFSDDWLRSLQLDGRDLGLAREIAFGLCRWYYSLRELLHERLQKPLRERDRDIECVLLIGLYQILVMRTEAHAAVNETVKLARDCNKKWATGLVNAVLRGVIRDGVELDESAAARAYPDWMRQRICADWGEQAEELLAAGSQRPPMTLRVDTRRCDVDEVVESLAADGIVATRHALVDSAILLETPCDVTQLPGFEQGLLSVQDASAQLAAGLLRCEPGERVLDACAAPGGKTAHLLQEYDDIEVDALDSSAARLERLRQNLERINRSARVLVADAASPADWFDGRHYDAVLADLPCSASGVLRRHPDIKLLRRESDIAPLLKQQAAILRALWGVLAPGGRLLYSTCSIFRAENEIQLESFLHEQADAGEIVLREVRWGELRTAGRQILTGRDNMDGFYYALLTKSADR